MKKRRMNPRKLLSLGQLEGDFFLQLMGEIDIAHPPLGAGFNVNLRKAGIHGRDAHPDLSIIYPTFQGADAVGIVVGNVFGDERAVRTDNADGGLIDLVHGAVIAAGDVVLAPRRGKRVGIADGVDAAGGKDRRPGESQAGESHRYLFHMAFMQPRNYRRVKLVPSVFPAFYLKLSLFHGFE